ncbi:MAG: hypothetical protein AAGJ80_14735, partial [Cyanobacteria bacterium J06553_1]
MIKDCKFELRPCYRCNKMHHNWRHPFSVPTVTTNSLRERGAPTMRPIALPTALLTVKCKRKYKRVRVFFDQGSQRTFISQRLVDQLNIPITGQLELELAGFNSTLAKQMYATVNAEVIMGGRYFRFQAVVKDEINTNIHTPGMNRVANHLRKRGVYLADVYRNDITTDVDMLIGADNYFQVVNGQHRVDGVNLIKTPAGSMISGPIKGVMNDAPGTVQNVTVLRLGENFDPITDRQIECQVDDQLKHANKLWDLDAIGIKDTEVLIEDSVAQEDYIRTVKYDGKQYSVDLPLKANRSVIPTNKGPAMAQLKNLLVKLKRDPETMKNYTQVIQSLEEMNFIERVKEEPTDKEVHYLPHHGVLKESESTPLRVVFNASSKPKEGVSLND